MRLYLHKRNSNQIEFGIIYGGIALVTLGAGWLLPILSFAPDCVFKGLTGIPCPTCGSTRSVMHLAHGDILHALAMNPLTTVCLLAAIGWFIASLMIVAFGLPRINFILDDKEKNVIRAGVIVLLLAQWAYLIIQS
jgi:Protein of unknown function (DUF2752)